MPLRVTDAAVVDLLRVGDRVGFVVADPDGRDAPRLLLEDAPIVAIPAREDGIGSGSSGRLVVVAVPRSVASAVAAAAATSSTHPGLEPLASMRSDGHPTPVGSRDRRTP